MMEKRLIQLSLNLNLLKRNLKLVEVIFIIIMSTVSCISSNVIKKDIEFIKTLKIELPNDRINTVFLGKDSVMTDFMDSKLKLVIYVDSLNCSPCIIKYLYHWDAFIDYAKNFNGKLKFYFIFSPKNNEEQSLRLDLKMANFNYHVIIDTEMDFEKLNPHLPKNKALHTFLLDENNKVILAGNPLYNKEIEKLFYKITREKLSK